MYHTLLVARRNREHTNLRTNLYNPIISKDKENRTRNQTVDVEINAEKAIPATRISQMLRGTDLRCNFIVAVELLVHSIDGMVGSSTDAVVGSIQAAVNQV